MQTRKVLNDADIETLFAAMSADPPDFLVVNPSPTLFVERARIARLVRAQRLATNCQVVDHTEAGCLMSYGADVFDLSRRAAGHAERILRGADPGRLPVQQPTRFQLVINLDRAKALGLSIPHALLARADRLID
ncbi:MAG: ABC transporter substrate binding protein [Reyranella sp.]|uniref:ABC transporter substrate binding protein n=1 Tax=Reyranella sp. TaxID=1929291 RepID=UPI003D0F0581